MKKSIIASSIVAGSSVIVAIIGKLEKINFPKIAGSELIFIGLVCLFIIAIIWIFTLLKKGAVHLAAHPIFKCFKYWDLYLDNNFILEDKGRQVIFTDILRNKLSIFKKNVEKYLPKMELAKGEDALCDCALDMFYTSMREFRRYYKDGNYSNEDKKALSVVIAKFMSWQNDRNEIINNEITSICQSDAYGSNTFKIMLVLQLLQISLSSTMIDASKTLMFVNGELSGLTYKGHKIK